KRQLHARRRFLAIRQDEISGCAKCSSGLASVGGIARQGRGPANQEVVGHAVSRDRLAIPMIDDISNVPVSFVERWGIQAIDAFVIVLAHQEQIRKIKAVRPCLGIKHSPHGNVIVDSNLIKADSSLVIGVNGLSDRKLCRELNRSVLAAANALEDKHREIVFDFIEAAVVPVAQFTFFIEECYGSPLAVLIHEFRALDRLSPLENTFKVRVPEPAEDAPELNEKLPVVPLG